MIDRANDILLAQLAEAAADVFDRPSFIGWWRLAFSRKYNVPEGVATIYTSLATTHEAPTEMFQKLALQTLAELIKHRGSSGMVDLEPRTTVHDHRPRYSSAVSYWLGPYPEELVVGP